MAGNDGYTVLLLQSDTTDGSVVFTDSSVGSSEHTLTAVGDIEHSTTQQKFGTTSISSDGTGDRITHPASVDWLFDGEFTVDFWVRLNATGSFYLFFGEDTGFWTISIYGTVFRFEVNGGAGATMDGTTSPVINTWYHVEVSRDSADKLRLFVDGVMEDSVASYATDIGNSTGDRSICDLLAGGGSLNGYMDEIRVSKGICRNPSDSSFTPPTASYTVPLGFYGPVINTIACDFVLSPSVSLVYGQIASATNFVLESSVIMEQQQNEIAAAFVLDGVVEVATVKDLSILADFVLSSSVDLDIGQALLIANQFVLSSRVEMLHTQELEIACEFVLDGTVTMSNDVPMAIAADFILGNTVTMWTAGEPGTPGYPCEIGSHDSGRWS